MRYRSRLFKMQKLDYFLISLLKTITRSGFSCPSCGNKVSSAVDRKYLVTSLRRCNSCGLLWRAPITSLEDSVSFYQRYYSQGFTTDMPSADKLDLLKEANFRGTEKDFSYYISVLCALGCKEGDQLLDFGCSWGYGSYQLKRAGYSVQAVEISRPRCAYAREKLGVDAFSSVDDIRGPFDIFFSSHVLEHVPSVSKTLDFAFGALKPGGLLVAFVPNGSFAYKQRNYSLWHKSWGLVHPTLIDDKFCRNAFAEMPMLLASLPYPLHEITTWNQHEESLILDLSGPELLCAVRKPR